MVDSFTPAGPSHLTAQIDVFFTSLVEQGASSLRAEDFLNLAAQATREQDQALASAAARLAGLLKGSALPPGALTLHLRAGLERLRTLVVEADVRMAWLPTSMPVEPPGLPGLVDQPPQTPRTAAEVLRQALRGWRPRHQRRSIASERAFLAEIAHNRYLIALTSVGQILPDRQAPAEESSVVRLASLFSAGAPESQAKRGLLLSAPGAKLCFAVDAIVCVDDFLMQPLPPVLADRSIFSGCTLLADGAIALLLDLTTLSECCSASMRR